MAGDLGRSFTWGCGVTLGVVCCLIALPLISWFACCGGLALFKSASDQSDNRQAYRPANVKSEAPAEPPQTIPELTPEQRAAVERDRKAREKRNEKMRLEAEQAQRQADEEAAARHRREDEDARAAKKQKDEADAKRRQEENRRAEEDAKVIVQAQRETDAQTLLGLAKKLIGKDNTTAARRLNDIIKRYPETQAATEAKKLLASL